MNEIETAISLEKIATNKRYRTTSLFWECRHIAKPGTIAVYNVSTKDHHNTLSMYNIFMDKDTEYEAGMYLLGSWDHWQTLCGSSFFNKHITKWREERITREEALAHKVLLESARNGNVTAARTILLDNRKIQKAGRPTNQQVAKAAATAVELDSFLVESLKRAK